MRALLLIALIMVAAATAMIPVLHASGGGGGGSYFFYMYGSSACPHCQRLHDFFEQHYRGHYSYCDMEYSGECSTVWRQAVTALGLHYDEMGVPTVFVVVNGTLSAVVVGEVTSTEFWDTLSHSRPVNGSLVPLYLGGVFHRYLRVEDPSRFVLLYLYTEPYTVYCFAGPGDDEWAGWLTESYRGHVEICNLSDVACAERLAGLGDLGINASRHPVTLIIGGGRLHAVVYGEPMNTSFLDKLIVMDPGENVPVYENTSLIGYITVSPNEDFMERYLGLAGNGGGGAGLDILVILPSLVFLALLDSVNPCTIAIYSGLLLATASGSRGRRGVAVTGLFFILGIITGYMALGLGLSTLFAYLPYWLPGLIAFAYGFYLFHRSLGEEKVCREDTCAPDRLHRARGPMAYVIGLTLSFTLLPCSAGPYIVFAAMIASRDIAAKLLLLLIYNLVFTLPLWIILAAYTGARSLARINQLWLTHNREIGLLTSIIIMIIGLYLLAT